MAANIFARYVWLIDIIRRYGRISYNNINRLWMRSGLNDGAELSRRMFHRHRIQIEETFGVVIECEKTPPYRYYIANERALANDGLRSWLIDTFAIDNLLRNNTRLHDRVLLEKVSQEGKRFLTHLMEAMESDKAVAISYRTDYSPTAHETTVEPYCLKMYQRRWYLVGNNNGMIKIYALDRITSCTVMEQTFSLPDGFSSEEYFTDCFGIIREKDIKPQVIKIKFTAEQANYIRALPIHRTQRETATNVFEVYLRPTFDFVQFLLSQLDTVEILAPQSLRQQVADIARRIFDKNSPMV